MVSRVMQLDSRTELVGVLGHPVGHSLSPRIHNAAFRAQGLDMVYLAFDVLPEQLSCAVAGLRALGMRGANITVPHKEAVLALLDDVDPLAARIGAVNTIVNEGGRLIGYNTDVAGFRATLGSVRSGGARGLKCVVVGAGGAARAVVAALGADGAAEISVYNRTVARAEALCADAATWASGVACSVIPPEGLRNAVSIADLVVNATLVGLDATVKDSAFPVDIVDSHHVVVDLVYGSRPTALVAAARDKGAVAIDGKEMLVMQAADSYRLWTGREPPVEVMRKCAK